MAAVDVSDATPSKRRVSWRTELVACETDTALRAMPPAEAVALWTDLWFQNEEFDIARREARLERLVSRYTPIVPPSYVGHKRPNTASSAGSGSGIVFDASIFPDAHPAPCCSAGAASCSPTSASGLCLARASGIGAGASQPVSEVCGPGFTAAASAADAVRAASMSLPGPPQPQPSLTQPPQEQPRAAPGGNICLQRAATFGIAPSVTLHHDHVQANRRSSSTATYQHSSSDANFGPSQKRPNTNPHGLTMSQRVAALQIGGPAKFAHSTMGAIPAATSHAAPPAT